MACSLLTAQVEQNEIIHVAAVATHLELALDEVIERVQINERVELRQQVANGDAQRLWQVVLSRPAVVLAVMTAILCFVGNHLLVITDPVESNYALTAKEMLASGDYVSPRIFGNYWYDKPIFLYWLLSLSYSVFGATDFASRLPAVLFGAMSCTLAAWFALHQTQQGVGFTPPGNDRAGAGACCTACGTLPSTCWPPVVPTHGASA